VSRRAAEMRYPGLIDRPRRGTDTPAVEVSSAFASRSDRVAGSVGGRR
jgi:hypothetical protein